jgi:hypothetical protein
MSRGFKIGIALLALVAVATVLITPDPTDDVQGVVHHLAKLHKLAVVASIPIKALAASQIGTIVSPDFLTNLPTASLLDLVCARLC